MRSRVISKLRGCVLVSLIGSCLAGCTSPWQQSFEPVQGRTQAEPSERVVIRRVPWERLSAALESIESTRASSDIHPDEWPAERRAAEHAQLVTALQLSGSPEGIEILGRSVFRSARDVDILDGSLSAYARSIGADYAIWSTTYLGKAERVEREAVTRSVWSTRRHRSRDGYADYDYLPYHETLYVPVVVERDEFAWVVFYARLKDR